MADFGDIIIRGLRIDGLVGVYDFERKLQQPMLFDLVLSYNASAPASSDSLDDAIDYAAVVKALRGFVQSRSDQLLEKLAEDCCNFLAQQFQPVRIVLKVEKPMAADALGCAAVGFQLERQYIHVGRPWLLLLGSNLGDDQVLRQAVNELAQLGLVELLGPIQHLPPSQGNAAWYYNTLARLRCGLPMSQLRAALRAIEVKLGRDRADGDVVAIDIDILARFENGWIADEHAQRTGKLDAWPAKKLLAEDGVNIQCVTD